MRYALTIALAIAALAAPAYGQTQLELTEQAGKLFGKADADLNHAYTALMTKISPAGKDALRGAQRAWLTFRDHECDFETLGSQGGSIRPMMIVECKTRLTRARLADLKTQLNCSEGDLSCGNQ